MPPTDYFAGLQAQLSELASKRLDPATQLGFQNIDQNRYRVAQNEAIRSIIENVELDPNDPASQTNLFSNLASVDEQFIDPYVKSANRQYEIGEQRRLEKQRLTAADELSAQLRDAGKPQVATIVAAVNRGAGVPAEIINQIAGRELITPNQEVSFADLSKIFTSISVSKYRQSLDTKDLVMRPEYEEHIKGGSGGPAERFEAISPADMEETRNQIINSPQFVNLAERYKERGSFFPAGDADEEEAKQFVVALGSGELSINDFYGNNLPSETDPFYQQLLAYKKKTIRYNNQQSGDTSTLRPGVGPIPPGASAGATLETMQTNFSNALNKLTQAINAISTQTTATTRPAAGKQPAGTAGSTRAR